MVIDLTVVPPPLKVTGQPCAFTENVLATPKSLLDCMTAGEKPTASRPGDHRGPARPGRHTIDLARRVRSSQRWSSVATVPSRASSGLPSNGAPRWR
jgi:hypothetical protein